jgi:hypothetical protein
MEIEMTIRLFAFIATILLAPQVIFAAHRGRKRWLSFNGHLMAPNVSKFHIMVATASISLVALGKSELKILEALIP